MNIKDIEELVASIRQFIQKAQTSNDTFEYCRLCDELCLAEAALADCNHVRPHLYPLLSPNNKPLALA